MLKALVEEHVAETKSPQGARLLNDWNREVERFWQVVPKEMLSRLPFPLARGPLTTAEAKRA
jgi:glutamate synthase (NADPH/NADH) large chain